MPIRLRQWLSIRNFGYAFLTVLLAIELVIIKSPPWPVRVIIGMLLAGSTFVPYLRRFTVPALPVFGYLISFYAVQFIGPEYRPQHIFVNILPTLERVLYGTNLSALISSHQHPALDILAWIPYGILHYTLPFVFAAVLFIFGPPGSLDMFGQAFGWMSLLGVGTQFLFPNASPWYEMSYGSAPADYTIHGEPGGLARIDKILGLKLYGSSFGHSPLVFGAFPSLHSAAATLIMLFLFYLKPKLWPLCIAHVMWMWWATMYLTHHYLIDLVGGSMYAFCAFFVARQYLRPLSPNCRNRLAYLGVTKSSLGAFVRSIERDSNSDSKEVSSVDDEEALLMKRDDEYGDEEEYPLQSRPLSLVSGISTSSSSSAGPSSPISTSLELAPPTK